MGLDQLPIDGLGEQGVDVAVAHGPVGPVEDGVGPGAHPREQIDAEEVGERENRLALAVSVGVDGIRLEVGTVLQQGIEDVDGFPYTAGDEVAEQRDVGRRDVVVGDPAIAAVADVALAQEVVLTQLHVGAVGDGHVRPSPQERKLEAGVGVDEVPLRSLKLLDVDVLVVDAAQGVAVHHLRGVTGRLAGPQIAAVAENRQEVTPGGVGDLGVGARRRAEVAGERRPVLGMLEDIEEMALGHAAAHRRLEGSEPLREALRPQSGQMRSPVGVDAQLAVVREPHIDLLGQPDQPLAQLGDEGGGVGRQTHRGTILLQPRDTLRPGQELGAIVRKGPGADHEDIAALQCVGEVDEDAEFQRPAPDQGCLPRAFAHEGLPALRGESEV